MKELFLTPELSQALAKIFAEMEAEYGRVAEELGHTCHGCPDNCCDSYFLHYTYIEWAYLWEGIRALDDKKLDRLLKRAGNYVDESREMLAQGERPQLMCPLNEEGLCSLYTHRLMICRMHGVPATMTRPDGQLLRFPGCFRCQEIINDKYQQETDAPSMDRTRLLHQLAQLESGLLENKRHLYPKVKLSIAEMIVNGPPRVDKPLCER